MPSRTTRAKKAASKRRVSGQEKALAVESMARRLLVDLAKSPHPPASLDLRIADSGISIRFVDRAAGFRDFASTSNAMLSVTDDSELRQGDKVPNQSEVDAVGPFVKRIARNDAEFASLVTNANQAIVFKDEEGTGADRLMTTTLKAGLDNLATLVSSEWASVKLRVTEAWDENGEHAPKSLHYEGRAADLTTAPVDGAKLGRLGRLAVKAGLGWVFFEDSAHIHVSVKG